MSDYPVEKKSNGFAMASLICGIVSMCCCNPLYLVSLAAVILGVIGLGNKDGGKGMAITGIILGVVAVGIGIIVDIIMLPLTFGASFFV